ncbi:hypothetical protein KUTeg_007654 [Tegillarca granosa]|uniref:Kazal-like domain-containing protein n=1 Tax=Tegillarca granosa TaxID=220873 RepID=A0ABQ9FDW1_TEGGR|nr:hypothetical protein KUTeg_007654 [Tegillarca granosa]
MHCLLYPRQNLTGEDSSKVSSGSDGGGGVANAGGHQKANLPLGGGPINLGGGLPNRGSLLGNPPMPIPGGLPAMFMPQPPLTGGQCNKKSGPVCGVYGNTYDNECDAHMGLESFRFQCKRSLITIVFVHFGTRLLSVTADVRVITISVSRQLGATADVRMITVVFVHFSHEAIECHGRCPCGNNCICTADNNPVCGSDGKTYGNKCSAECKNVTVDCKDECPCPCPCTFIHDPVCGVNNRNYLNPCAASCESVKVACKKRCPCDNSCENICPTNSNQVCGTDGVTYQNPCVAHCKRNQSICIRHCVSEEEYIYHQFGNIKKKNRQMSLSDVMVGVRAEKFASVLTVNKKRVRVACKGACPCTRTCICPKTHQPVCGSDGQNYTNPCLAECKKEVSFSVRTIIHTCDFFRNVIAQCRGNCPCRLNCFCPPNLLFMPPSPPVCGVNGIQYPSACQARCENVEVSCIGPCPCTARRKCKCPKTSQQLPVCGTDGQTHQSRRLTGLPALPAGTGGGQQPSNQNGGQSSNTENNYPSCSQCPEVDNKVCGTDGNTYANPCKALCRQINIQCGNECPCHVKPQESSEQPSNPTQQPSENSEACRKCEQLKMYYVCGDDGVTFMHACLALCNCLQTTDDETKLMT